MRAYLGGHVGPLYVRSGNLARRGAGRRRANMWTWLALFPLMLMWATARLLVLFYVWLGVWVRRGARAAWLAARR